MVSNIIFGLLSLIGRNDDLALRTIKSRITWYNLGVDGELSFSHVINKDG